MLTKTEMKHKIAKLKAEYSEMEKLPKEEINYFEFNNVRMKIVYWEKQLAEYETKMMANRNYFDYREKLNALNFKIERLRILMQQADNVDDKKIYADLWHEKVKERADLVNEYKKSKSNS